MRISSFFLSLLLHLLVFAAVLFRPDPPLVDPTASAYQVSLVMGDPGGENLPSPILGPRPPASGNPVASTIPASRPETSEAPALPARTPDPQTSGTPRPESVPEPQPGAAPVRQPEAPIPPAGPKAPEAAVPSRAPEPSARPDPKPEPRPEPPRKPEEKPAPSTPEPPRPRRDPLAEALADARRAAGRDQPARPPRGSSASRALADLEKQAGSGVGGGGGQGDGPGGGGIHDVYAGLVMLAVQPYWSMPTYSRENLVVQVRIRLDPQGHVLDCAIERSSGRADFDASAVNAVLRAGTLPEPPTPAQQDLLINFNAQQLAGR